MTPVSAISMRNIDFSYGEKNIFTNFSLEMRAGESYSLIGRSGCGKTTALELMNGLLTPNRGEVFVNGVRFDFNQSERWRRSMGYSIQGSGLFPHMTLFENLSIIARKEGWKTTEIKERIEELLLLLSLPNHAEFLKKKPREISGGQQQRVGIARALFMKPSIMLMDEPFSALDPITKSELQKEFLKLRAQLGFTLVWVTHDLPEAFSMSDKMILLNKGVIEQMDSPSKFLLAPKTEYVAQFINSHSPATLLKNIYLYSVLNTNIYVAQKTVDGLSLVHLETKNQISFNNQEKARKFLEEFGQSSIYWVNEEFHFIGSQSFSETPHEINPFFLEAEEPILDGMKALLRERKNALPVVNKRQFMMGVFSEGALNAL